MQNYNNIYSLMAVILYGSNYIVCAQKCLQFENYSQSLVVNMAVNVFWYYNAYSTNMSVEFILLTLYIK